MSTRGRWVVKKPQILVNIVFVCPLIRNTRLNTSILTGKYPTNWKIAKVIPLRKIGDKNVLKNQTNFIIASSWHCS